MPSSAGPYALRGSTAGSLDTDETEAAVPEARDATSPAPVHVAGWVLVGMCLAFGILGAFTIGPLALLVAVALTVITLRLGGGNVAAVGVLVGIGAALLYVAWVNRGGPGNVCVTTDTGGSCTEEWSPWPWLSAGVALIVAATAVLVRTGHRH